MENQQVDVDTLIAAALSDGGENDVVFKTYVACVGQLCREAAHDCSSPQLTEVLFAAVHRHEEKTLQAVLADSRVRAIPKDSCSLGFGGGYAYVNIRKSENFVAANLLEGTDALFRLIPLAFP